ncbi:hypothetical protein B0H13DRAFT_2351880 [Mycena leptocephala]|nr:hypothetical protein B0H13DRAFT_2351880 [Mycena leptocephala]
MSASTTPDDTASIVYTTALPLSGHPADSGALSASEHFGSLSVANSGNWLGRMVFAVNALASGAEFVPFPYIRTTFRTVLFFLEAVEKVKRNREDLKDLCFSVVDIVNILRSEVSVHGDVAAARFMVLCDDFISFLVHLSKGLQKLNTARRGVLGMIKEVVNAPIIADTILQSRARINELRSNFTVRDRARTWRILDDINFLKLVAAMEANLNTYRITESLANFNRKPASTLQFRSIPLGDINLLRDIAPSMGPQKIKIYIARINGEHSNMTVVQYREEKEKWASDFARYSSMRHPNVWQLFGISTAPALHSLIFHDELMRLAVYRMSHRPSSDLAWAFLEATLFRQFEVMIMASN